MLVISKAVCWFVQTGLEQQSYTIVGEQYDFQSERILIPSLVYVLSQRSVQVIKFVQKNQKPQSASRASTEDPEGRFKYPL